MRIFLALACALACAVSTRSAWATNVFCQVIQREQTFINLCENYDRGAASQRVELEVVAGGLEALRRRLVRDAGLEDRPILIELPWTSGFTPPPRFARNKRCETATADGEEAPRRVGDCFLVVSTGNDARRPEQLRTLVLALATLPPTSATPAPDLRGVVHLEPALSAPTGPFAVVPKWDDAVLSLVLRRGAHDVAVLPSLAAPRATPPTWSPSGAHVAYASLEAARIHDVASDSSRLVTFAAALGISRAGFNRLAVTEVALGFSSDGSRLVVAFDTELESSYAIVAVDLADGSAR